MEFAFLGAINLLYSGYSKVNNHQLLKEAIKEIILFQEQQINHLETLSLDITALKQGPMYSAKIYLNDATKEHRSEQECKKLVIKAKEKFIDALGILEAKSAKDFSEYQQICVIQYLISLCWSLLLQKEDANDWLDLSLETNNLNQINLEKQICGGEDNLNRMHEEIEGKKNASIRKQALGAIGGPLVFIGLTAIGALSNNKIRVLQSNYSKLEQQVRKEQKIYEEASMFQQLLIQTKEEIRI